MAQKGGSGQSNAPAAAAPGMECLPSSIVFKAWHWMGDMMDSSYVLDIAVLLPDQSYGVLGIRISNHHLACPEIAIVYCPLLGNLLCAQIRCALDCYRQRFVETVRGRTFIRNENTIYQWRRHRIDGISTSFLWAGITVDDWSGHGIGDLTAEEATDALVVAPMTAALADVFDEEFARLVVSFMPRPMKKKTHT